MKRKHLIPKGDWLLTAVVLAWLTTMGMYCLLQKELFYIAFPYHFQYKSFAGYWTVAKHSGFFFCVCVFWLEYHPCGFWLLLLILFWCTVNSSILFTVLSWYICQFILLWYLMAYVCSFSLILEIETLTIFFFCHSSSWEALSLSPVRLKYELPYWLFIFQLQARFCC